MEIFALEDSYFKLIDVSDLLTSSSESPTIFLKSLISSSRSLTSSMRTFPKVAMCFLMSSLIPVLESLTLF